MKKLIPAFSILVVMAIVVILFVSLSKKENMTTIHKGNINKLPIPIKPGHFHDTQCAMVITDTTYACEVIAPNGNTWFFDDPGCMVKWIEDKPFKDEAILWAYARDTDTWIDAKKAWYSLTDPTPMNYGFGAYENPKEGYIDFRQMTMKMLRGENLTDPRVKKKLLGN